MRSDASNMKLNAYCTVSEVLPPTEVDRHAVHFDHQQGRLRDHLVTAAEMVMDDGRRSMTSSLFAIVRHFQRTRHLYQLDVEEKGNTSLASWAWANNAIFVLPDGTVTDPLLRCLADGEFGQPDDQAQIPFPRAARQRKAQTEVELRNRLIEVPEALPPIPAECEVSVRSATEVALRASSLFLVAVRAESLAADRPLPAEQFQQRAPEAFAAMSPRETEFMHSATPDQQAVAEMAWRYEALYALQWALGLQPEWKWPDEICDVPAVAGVMVDRNHATLMMSKLRPTTAILDQADVNYRLLWSARQAGLEQREPPAGIDGGVLSERQHAFNWLIRYDDNDWDDVDTPT
ncbi:MAG: DUF4272 domain-containing protein [Planctomycetota bacterium]